MSAYDTEESMQTLELEKATKDKFITVFVST